jgi:hypothetical protein
VDEWARVASDHEQVRCGPGLAHLLTPAREGFERELDVQRDTSGVLGRVVLVTDHVEMVEIKDQAGGADGVAGGRRVWWRSAVHRWWRGEGRGERGEWRERAT